MAKRVGNTNHKKQNTGLLIDGENVGAMLDADKEYDTWFSGKARNRLDYIFISNSMATEYTAITNQYGDALEFNVTDHMMIEAAFIKQEPFKEYCERILAYYNEQ